MVKEQAVLSPDEELDGISSYSHEKLDTSTEETDVIPISGDDSFSSHSGEKFTERPAAYSLKNSCRSVGTSCTTPKPFTLDTEKCASFGNFFPVSEVPSNFGSKLSSIKDSRFKRIMEGLILKKPLQSEQNNQHMQQGSSSVASPSVVPSSAARKKKMFVSAPKFQCTERAEKRKELPTTRPKSPKLGRRKS